jgi:hypothetical protein
MPWDCELPGAFPYKGSEVALCPLTSAALIAQAEGKEWPGTTRAGRRFSPTLPTR